MVTLRILPLLVLVHGWAIADDDQKETYSVAGDVVTTRVVEGTHEVTLKGNARLACELGSGGRLTVSGNQLVLKHSKPDGGPATLRSFVGAGDCRLVHDDLQINCRRVTATRKSSREAFTLKLFGDVRILHESSQISASTAVLTLLSGTWKIDDLELKRLNIRPARPKSQR